MTHTNDDPDRITCFAVTNYRDIRRLFGIKEKNRRAHIYIIGKTGTGKSTPIENMVASDIPLPLHKKLSGLVAKGQVPT